MGRIQLLDCTLRDGAYIVDSRFGTAAIRGIIEKTQEANIDIIECGWLKNAEHVPGTSFYHVPDDLVQYLTDRRDDVMYTVMIDWDRYDLDFLPPYDGRSIDAVRVVFPHGKHREGIAVGRGILKKGYRVMFQAANTLAYSNEELVALADEINTVDAVGLSIVDTFGAMYREDLERIVRVLDAHVRPDIRLGFHSHNNRQLSFSLSMDFVEMLADTARDIIVDASLCGMGRGAGNATTELVVSYLNGKRHCGYDLNAVMDAIDTYMGYFQENYSWGYSTPYFISGLYCCHVNNIAYLLKNHRTSCLDMRNIIESLDPEDRRKYDYDLLERKYIENQGRAVDDAGTLSALRERLDGREVLLVAPGVTAESCREKVQAFIREHHPAVIAVNALLPDYEYDYIFLTNAARYSYAKNAYAKQFARTEKILLSGVRIEPGEGEYVINFNRVIKRGWEHFDNAAICCLRLMDRLGIPSVAIAGFDGFCGRYNESYADPQLPALGTVADWGALNAEILDMFRDFKETAHCCRDVRFLTDSYFNR